MAGLRERKKQETRAALSWAALRMAVERGLAGVTVDEIAAEAGVSPRTFNNYFASKYEAIVWRHLDRFTRIAEQLRTRPTTDPIWTALTDAVRAVFGTPGPAEPGPPSAWTAGVRLLIEQPELRGEFVKAAAAAERELAAAVAERTGTDPDRDMYPRLVAAAVGTAVHVASEQWLRADPPVALASLLDDALRQLAAGLPDPRT
ncbi:TetR family transcriptional regulator [Pseudonocardia hierapolitana]|uniref:TetR family transcriptional regulator n=1 Tax=Pseudonocardia hierapolitana TaxID=1128676 RepID=A0A561T5H5_9PSEU|nr:TetR family transcriptional regulator [Pseudonocardia hierapolitana]TWF82362.1 TetR family transcriptional regulator [Pseudonocardia hierapolitana]